LAALPAAAPGAALAASLALVGATVHTVSGPDLDNATVVIVNGRITAVGRNLTPPADAEIISCAGKHLYPGFVSALSALGLTEINSVLGTNDYQEAGTTNPDIRSEVQVNPESELLTVALANGVTSALIAGRGGSI